MKTKLSFFIICLLSTAVYAEQTDAFLDAKAILAGWDANYGSIESMEVQYTEKVLKVDPIDESSDLNRIVKVQHVDRLESGSKYRIKYSSSPEGFKEPGSVMMHAFNGVSTKEFFLKTKTGSIQKGLTGRNVEIKNAIKNYLMLNVHSINGKPEKTEFAANMMGLTGSEVLPGIKVNKTIQQINGEKCHLIEYEIKNDSLDFHLKLWVAHEKGMLPMKFERSYKHGDDQEGSGFEIKSLSSVDTEGGVLWYPKEAIRYQDSKEGKVEYQLSVSKFRANFKTNKDDFDFEFPIDTKVNDKILKLQYVVGGDRIDKTTPVYDLGEIPEENSKYEADAKNSTKQMNAPASGDNKNVEDTVSNKKEEFVKDELPAASNDGAADMRNKTVPLLILFFAFAFFIIAAFIYIKKRKA